MKIPPNLPPSHNFHHIPDADKQLIATFIGNLEILRTHPYDTETAKFLHDFIAKNGDRLKELVKNSPYITDQEKSSFAAFYTMATKNADYLITHPGDQQAVEAINRHFKELLDILGKVAR